MPFHRKKISWTDQKRSRSRNQLNETSCDQVWRFRMLWRKCCGMLRLHVFIWNSSFYTVDYVIVIERAGRKRETSCISIDFDPLKMRNWCCFQSLIYTQNGSDRTGKKTTNRKKVNSSFFFFSQPTQIISLSLLLFFFFTNIGGWEYSP